MKIICISDIHLKQFHIDKILSWEIGYDKAVFHNDIFDQFGDSVSQNGAAAIWLKNMLDDDRNVFLWSNHVMSYAFPENGHMSCSGFSEVKNNEIRRYLTQTDFLKHKTYFKYKNILFSHAGFCRDWFLAYEPNVKTTIDGITDFIDKNEDNWMKVLQENKGHPIYGAGKDRGGFQKIGGCTWGDFSHINPITDIIQVVGHTPISEPTFRFKNTINEIPMWRKSSIGNIKKEWLMRGCVLDLDTHLNHYMVIEDDAIRIFNINRINVKSLNSYGIEKGECIFEINLND